MEIVEILKELGMSLFIVAASMGFSVSTMCLTKAFVEAIDWIWRR